MPVAQKTAARTNSYATKRSTKIKPRTTRKSRAEYSDSDESADSRVYNSDNLDDDDSPDSSKGVKAQRPVSPKKRPRKKRKVVDAASQSELELEEGQEVAGIVVQAPKTGHVPPGQISANTFEFLGKLKDSKCNDRTW